MGHVCRVHMKYRLCILFQRLFLLVYFFCNFDPFWVLKFLLEQLKLRQLRLLGWLLIILREPSRLCLLSSLVNIVRMNDGWPRSPSIRRCKYVLTSFLHSFGNVFMVEFLVSIRFFLNLSGSFKFPQMRQRLKLRIWLLPGTEHWWYLAGLRYSGPLGLCSLG